MNVCVNNSNSNVNESGVLNNEIRLDVWVAQVLFLVKRGTQSLANDKSVLLEERLVSVDHACIPMNFAFDELHKAQR